MSLNKVLLNGFCVSRSTSRTTRTTVRVTTGAPPVVILVVLEVLLELLETQNPFSNCVVYFQFPAILFGSVLGRVTTYSIFNKTVSLL